MLIGGFQEIDIESVLKESPDISSDIKLRFDKKNIYKNKKYFNTGRTASIFLYKYCNDFKEGDTILLPDYLCLTLITALEEAKMKYEFYKINRNLEIDLDDLKNKINPRIKGIYITHFFGVPVREKVSNYLKDNRKKQSIRIIEDITQTHYSEEECMGFGDYIICSLRKWMPVTDGGLLAAEENIKFDNVKVEDGYNEASYYQLLITCFRQYFNKNPQKNSFDYNRLEKNANKKRYEELKMRSMTSISKKIMLNLDENSLIRKRKENYSFLYENLKHNRNIVILSKEIDKNSKNVPFGFVILVENRDDFYNYLIKHNIIGEIQWNLPVKYYIPGEDALYLSKHNLMIHCDQRYGLDEMKYVVKIINDFFK